MNRGCRERLALEQEVARLRVDVETLKAVVARLRAALDARDDFNADEADASDKPPDFSKYPYVIEWLG